MNYVSNYIILLFSDGKEPTTRLLQDTDVTVLKSEKCAATTVGKAQFCAGDIGKAVCDVRNIYLRHT